MIQPLTIDYALHYASLGMPVIPLLTRGKKPVGRLVPNGRNDATTDPQIIQQWFSGNDYNVGIVTGKESKIFVLDQDDKDQGNLSLSKLESKYGALPPTLTQRTGNGMHYFFEMPDTLELSNSAKKVAPGIDIRGKGGYVVAAPSTHENGNTYTWLVDSPPNRELISKAPPWLINLIAGAPAKATTSKINNSGVDIASEGFQVPDLIKDGEGREDFIIRYAGHLRIKGISQSDIERILLDYNQMRISPPLDTEVVLDRARRYRGTGAHGPAAWSEPNEIKTSLPPVHDFDFLLLPNEFEPWIKDIAERMQCPVEFLAIGALVGAGAVVGNRIGIQPKEHDTGWVEVPNIWGAVVGSPGLMKSPALDQVLAPVKKIEAQAQSAFSVTKAQYEINRMVYEATKKQMEAQIKKGGTVLPHQLPTQPDEPQPPRYIVNDATYQKLGQVLSGNPHGVLVFQDELSGLLVRLDAEGQEAARAFYLEAWNGKQSYTFDRIERGTVRIPRLCISLLGGLQPSKLRGYLHAAVNGGKGDDGLAQRLQMLVYPDISKQWQRIDRKVDIKAAEAANRIYEQLAAIDPIALGARQIYPDSIPVMRFTEEAQLRFNAWWSNLENLIRSGEHSSFMESHISKYRKLVPALALLDHLIVGKSGDINLESLSRAIAWQKFLTSHAKRAYASVTSGSMDAAKSLVTHIKNGDLEDRFTVRNVYRKNWSLLSTAKDAAEAIEILEEFGWLQSVCDSHTSGNEGRPTIRYLINPLIKSAT